MSQRKIICPYCFEEFSQDEVEFKVKSIYDEDSELLRLAQEKFENMGEDASDATTIEEIQRNESNKEMLDWIEKERPYIKTTDKKLEKFWSAMGKIPHELEDFYYMPVLTKADGIELIRSENCVFDCKHRHKKSDNEIKVCPKCHNILPIYYGINEVKKITVIGTAGSGKTVYISQLVKGLGEYVSKAGLSAFPVTNNGWNYINNNKISENEDLPKNTSPHIFCLPVFYDIMYHDDENNIKKFTLVIYDIAGENCENCNKNNEESRRKQLKCITYADAIILLVSPKALFDSSDNLEKSDENEIRRNKKVCNVIYDNTKVGGKTSKVPVAICVSKSDEINLKASDIGVNLLEDVTGAKDEGGNPVFNSENYNKIEKFLRNYIYEKSGDRLESIRTDWENMFEHYNFFAVSALGTSCQESEVEIDGRKEKRSRPISEPQPHRIEEPLLWIFKNFGFVKSNMKNKTYRVNPLKLNKYKCVYSKNSFKKRIEGRKISGVIKYEYEEDKPVNLIEDKGKMHNLDDEYKKGQKYKDLTIIEE